MQAQARVRRKASGFFRAHLVNIRGRTGAMAISSGRWNRAHERAQQRGRQAERPNPFLRAP
jgi:hypothetical protein